MGEEYRKFIKYANTRITDVTIWSHQAIIIVGGATCLQEVLVNLLHHYV